MKLLTKPTDEPRMRANWLFGKREFLRTLLPGWRCTVMTSLLRPCGLPLKERVLLPAVRLEERSSYLWIFVFIEFFEHIALGCLPGCDSATFINVFSELGEHIALSPWLGCDDAAFIFNFPKLSDV